MGAPGDKDIEVHLFGPGYGESVLVHVGHNDWLVVDSCVPRGSKVPAALSYLESIGVDPAEGVKLIVASHWHDDHVRGLSEIYRSSPQADFVCSAALLERDFVMLTMASASRPMIEAGSGVDEFMGILSELERRKNEEVAGGTRRAAAAPRYAHADKCIWSRSQPSDLPVTVVSLSPSDAEYQLSVAGIAKLLANQRSDGKTARRRVPSVKPNNTAVALHVTVGDVHLLLGADLEELGANPKTGTPPYADCGWTAVVASDRRPQQKSALFKVAHHGSITAHCDSVWTEMLEPKVIAMMTPFRNGSVNLPTDSDVTRIRGRADRAFLSAKSASRRAKPSNPVVAREFGLTARAVWEATTTGHIHATLVGGSPQGTWQVLLNNGAYEL